MIEDESVRDMEMIMGRGSPPEAVIDKKSVSRAGGQIWIAFFGNAKSDQTDTPCDLSIPKVCQSASRFVSSAKNGF